MDYKTFTNDLSNYNENILRYQKAKDELEVILYDLCGVRGVSYDSIMVKGNPSVKALNWLKQEDKYNEKEAELRRYETALVNVERAKKKIPMELWVMLTDKFVRGMTYTQVGMKYGYSGRGMWAYLRRETERFL
jgi:hypothetical protein